MSGMVRPTILPRHAARRVAGRDAGIQRLASGALKHFRVVGACVIVAALRIGSRPRVSRSSKDHVARLLDAGFAVDQVVGDSGCDAGAVRQIADLRLMLARSVGADRVRARWIGGHRHERHLARRPLHRRSRPLAAGVGAVAPFCTS